MAQELTIQTHLQQIDLQQIVYDIKNAIVQTRYNAIRNANAAQLSLYYHVGEYIVDKITEANWGDKVLDQIASLIQQELPGQRGFSSSNLKKMRRFYNEWKIIFGSLPTNQTLKSSQGIEISSLTTNQLTGIQLADFLATPFTHHYTLLTHTTVLTERLFYLHRISAEFWSNKNLEYQLSQHLYQKLESEPNNFQQTLPTEELRRRASRAFREDYELSFLNIEDPDAWDEKRVENEIVNNICKFILALGPNFSFVGEQYRLIIDGEERFIDLLFFNRSLRSLVAIELKWTEFKPEYIGKLNFYLSALDDTVRLPDENPSIGIILCRGAKQKTVEYALRDTSKPMGVATYHGAGELPSAYGQALSQLDNLKDLLPEGALP